jgi:hypothetical protein
MSLPVISNILGSLSAKTIANLSLGEYSPFIHPERREVEMMVL